MANKSNENYDPNKYYKEYMASMYSAENIQKAGGVDNFNKAIKKFKRHEKKLLVRDIIRDIPWCVCSFIFPTGIIVCISYFVFNNFIGIFENISFPFFLAIAWVIYVIYMEIRLNRK
jgi:hypothetical protein